MERCGEAPPSLRSPALGSGIESVLFTGFPRCLPRWRGARSSPQTAAATHFAASVIDRVLAAVGSAPPPLGFLPVATLDGAQATPVDHRVARRAPRRLSTRCAQRHRRAADDMASRSTASRAPISLRALTSSVAAAMASNSPRGLFSQSSQASTRSRCWLGEAAALRRCWRRGGRCRAGARASADGASLVGSADGASYAQHGHALVRTAVNGSRGGARRRGGVREIQRDSPDLARLVS